MHEKPNQVFDFESIRRQSLRGSRLNDLFEHFENIACGSIQIPKSPIEAATEFISQSEETEKYHELLQQNMGTFNRHTFASIPFFLEETVRVGVALSRLTHMERYDLQKPMTFYSISSADGTQARTLAEYTNGMVRTLSDSPNESNYLEFKKRLSHPYSLFHKGPFTDVSPELFKERYASIMRNDAISIIWEDTAFQMYGGNRTEQIAYVRRLLADDGLMLFTEKMRHDNQEEYARREQVKDSFFKSRYFTSDQIDAKKKNILLRMEESQVTLDEFKTSVKSQFAYAWLIWNSGNFYEVVASDNKDRIEQFISLLPKPYVPKELAFEMPMVRSLW